MIPPVLAIVVGTAAAYGITRLVEDVIRRHNHKLFTGEIKDEKQISDDVPRGGSNSSINQSDSSNKQIHGSSIEENDNEFSSNRNDDGSNRGDSISSESSTASAGDSQTE